MSDAVPKVGVTDLPDGSVLEHAARGVARWRRTGGSVHGRLYALGGVFVAAEGPSEHGAEAAEALARSYHLPEPYLAVGQFLELMNQQGVPPAVAEAWAKSARVTDDGTYLTWVRPPT